MFNSVSSYISVIMLLVFAAISEVESTKLEDIEKLLSKSKDQLPISARFVINSEAAIKQLQDKINNETAVKGNGNLENYVNCWRESFRSFSGLTLFDDIRIGLTNQHVQYGPYAEEYSLLQCVQEESDAYEAMLRSAESVDCDGYGPLGNEEDLQELQKKIKASYKYRMFYGHAMLLTKIHETAIERLKRAGKRN
uniref:Secreted protein n=1 Tax=Trichobilharzia regenti TaxID=157069 RepID=A0AA85IQY9_TRIRE|nr:unnamed protein product [Trichobilharzia regenti]